MSKTFKTPKGTELPLTNLKGKDYLMVAYRLQWLNEENPNFMINTDYLKTDAEESIVRAVVTIYNSEGQAIKSASAVKRETKKDFGDHLEKAETAAIGRALSMLGYGTQYALADLDEGDRIVDTPLSQVSGSVTVETKPKRSSFRKPKAEEPPAEEKTTFLGALQAEADGQQDGWV